MKIKWLDSKADRRKGFVEDASGYDAAILYKWKARGWVKFIDDPAPKAAETVLTSHVEEPPSTRHYSKPQSRKRRTISEE